MTVKSGTADTFPKLLLEHARVRGERPAIREKDLGIWQTWTWREVRDEVEWLACGLAQAGLRLFCQERPIDDHTGPPIGVSYYTCSRHRWRR